MGHQVTEKMLKTLKVGYLRIEILQYDILFVCKKIR